MIGERYIKTAHSCATDAAMAVHELHASLVSVEAALFVFFCSSHYDLDVIADEINALFPNIPTIGCTTAGEIGPAGLRQHSLVGMVFPASACAAVVGYQDHIDGLVTKDADALVEEMKRALEKRRPDNESSRRFALELIDGLSNSEESLAFTYQKALGDIPLIGGSAGDDLKIEQTWVFCNGQFRSRGAALALVETTFPITIFRTHHFVGGPERLVVTEVDPATRTVREINGLPAAQEYARMLGVPQSALQASFFAESPVVVRINGNDYVRSIRNVNADGSLTFYCAIERGVILRVAHAVNFMDNLQYAFQDVRTRVGEPQLVIACDCIFRNMELTHAGLAPAVEALYRNNNVLGFNTYGEQFLGIHVNQTLTGIAIGREQMSDHD